MVKSAREKLVSILEALKDRIASPSDVIAITGLPRYEVLASFHVLEALGVVEVVYARGNYKLYRLTEAGEKLLAALKNYNRVAIEVVAEERPADESTEAVSIAGTVEEAEVQAS